MGSKSYPHALDKFRTGIDESYYVRTQIIKTRKYIHLDEMPLFLYDESEGLNIKVVQFVRDEDSHVYGSGMLMEMDGPSNHIANGYL
ncbi:hypothetical protein VNO77_01703 [Canavalia gladiata]|uniref:Uncharacterized protein n=1 Tax=Canavalia gladiata TaxID=3824 RepID=A0AAN9MY52_CANGL